KVDFRSGKEGCARETQEGCPAPLKSIFSELCKSSENGLSGEKRFFRHAECRCSHEQRHF
ncbi:hypothetical protein, partial [Dysosmobacter sp.]|uniref:hypothetical protein n=1 Tax=Dysosmobacter sp. TaxID=2591382 RepID=UPI003A8D2CF2